MKTVKLNKDEIEFIKTACNIYEAIEYLPDMTEKQVNKLDKMCKELFRKLL